MSVNLQSNKIEKLDKIRDGLSYSIGEPQVSITELMNRRFIVENTDFETWENLLGAAGVLDESDLETPDFNEFINSHTRFKDWESMLIHSANQYSLRYEGKEETMFDIKH
ncbi:MAG TPA: hypothetical protein VF599_17255 [Pyrinomonadaceae bacterium]|jgi:hypothetical protein